MTMLTDTDATAVTLVEKRGTHQSAYPHNFLRRFYLPLQPVRPPLWRRLLRLLFD